jgi:hypothetical protein
MNLRFTGLLILFFFSCRQVNHSPSVTSSSADSSKLQLNVERSELDDSIDAAQVLQQALKIAYNNRSKDTFFFEADSFNLYFGHLFSKDKKHLCIKRDVPAGQFANVYMLKNDSFIETLDYEGPSITPLRDTIFDVNGDHQKDFLLNWYPPNGCCLRDVYEVYLYQSKLGKFARPLRFMNPIFHSDKKMILGLEYGWDAPLYEYKWKGYDVDTIGYFFRPGIIYGKHYLWKRHFDDDEKGKIIKCLPKEFADLEYQWY